MVGVGVVTLFTVFAASIKATIDESVSQSFSGDLVVQAGNFGSGGVSPDLATEIGQLPEIEESVGLGSGRAKLGDDTTEVKVADPSGLTAVLDLDMVDGELGDLGDGEVALNENMADDQGWSVGDTIPVTFADGTSEELTVAAIYEPSEIVGNAVLSRGTWAPHAVQDLDSSVLMTLADGVDLDAGKAAAQAVADDFGGFDVLDRQEYIDEQAGQIDIMLGLVYVLLGLAIIIALMGIANTLSLSVHERTRELGLLRAVGETRSQLRSMIRWESVIIAVFGTIGGLGLGVFLGWALVQAVSGGTGDGPVTTTFAAPVNQLLIVLVVGAIAGVLAGIRPARRAARLDVLDAIATQ
jgi:putative ABC transport system permease protein